MGGVVTLRHSIPRSLVRLPWPLASYEPGFDSQAGSTEDRLWFDELHAIWVLQPRDRRPFFQPGAFDTQPNNALWAALPLGLDHIALVTYPGPDKGK